MTDTATATATDTALAMAAWFRDMLETTRTRNKEVSEACTAEGLNLSEAYVSLMKSRGMSVDRALAVAEIMGWDKPPLSETLSLGDRHKIVEVLVKGAQETSIVISSLHPVAGVNSHNNEHEVLEQIKIPTEWLRSSYPNISNLSNLALCSISGDSMEPTFKALDTVMVDTTVQNFDYDGVFVFTYHNTLLIKRVQAIPGTGFMVISDNKTLYDQYSVPNEDLDNLTVHGRVIGKFEFKKI